MIRGRIWKYGKNVDTDVIIPGRYCNLSDPAELAKHCLEDLDPGFVKKVRPGDLIVAENNFGCGSSREVAPVSLKASGIAAVVATSFARIFYRNCINIGLPIFECPDVHANSEEGDELEIDPASGTIKNLRTGQVFQAAPFPEFMRKIMAKGGLIGYAGERLEEIKRA